MSQDTPAETPEPAPLENRAPATDDPVLLEEHLDEALEDTFPASDPLPTPVRA